MELLLQNSPITGFDYYTSRQGMGYTLYVRLKPHHIATHVREEAFDEIQIGELREDLRIRGVKGKPTPLHGPSAGGFLPIAMFSGKDDPYAPRLQQRCY